LTTTTIEGLTKTGAVATGKGFAAAAFTLAIALAMELRELAHRR
jgi:hypothetical protein